MAKEKRTENYIEKNIEELNELAKEKKDELQKLVQEILKNKEKNVKKISLLRKEIARIQTAKQAKVNLGQKE